MKRELTMDHGKRIANILSANATTTRLSGVFDDFAELSALTLRNAADRSDAAAWDEREKQYCALARKYDRRQLNRFAEALARVVLAMREQPTDVMGRLYMELGLGNDRLGQFFTPYDVARMMAHFGLGTITDQAQQRGWAELYEPACGAAAFVIATAELMLQEGLNPQRQLFVSAEDVSPPAVVHRRNTLTGETYDSWPTGAPIHRGWPALS